MSHLHINSTKNPKVKQWLQFHKGHYRNKSEFFLVEGIRECSSAIASKFELVQLIYCSSLLADDQIEQFIKKIDSSVQIFSVSESVYAKVAYREASEGILAICRKNNLDLEGVKPEANESNYFILIENPEKPGNLGAILRTADAVGAKALIITGTATDHYNPNVIRASLGTFFQVPVIRTSNEEVLNWARNNGIGVYSAALPSFNSFYDIAFPQQCICAFGAESTGLSDFWKSESDINFTIPMKGTADSLNLSVSVAIVSYEFLRQKL